MDAATETMLRNIESKTGKSPSTVSRLDVGLNLKGAAPGGRLEPAAGFNSMCTHRVRIESADQIDEELLGWVRQAYDAAG